MPSRHSEPTTAELDRRHRARRPPVQHKRSSWRDGFPARDPDSERAPAITETDWLRLVVASDPARQDARQDSQAASGSRQRRRVRSDG